MATSEVLTGLVTAHFHDLSMTVGGRKTRERSETKLQLELDDGSSITVNTDEAQLMPNVEESAQFGELVERFPWMEIFMHSAPGDGVKTRVVGVSVKPGDLIAVRGLATREFAPGDGYRDRGDARIAGIDAQIIAAGPNAAETVSKATLSRPAKAGTTKAEPRAKSKKRKKPKKSRNERQPSIVVPLLNVGAGVGFLGYATVLVPDQRSNAVLIALLGFHWLAVGILYLRRRRFMADLRQMREDTSGKGWRTDLGMVLALTFSLAGFLEIALASTLWNESGNSRQGMIVLALMVGASVTTALVALLRRERRSYKRLRQVASAPTKVKARTWCAMDGAIDQGRYKRSRLHTRHRSTSTDREGRTRSQVWYTYQDTVRNDPMTVTLDNGERLHVDTSGALIGANLTTISKSRLVEQIKPGERVRVVGRPARDGDGWTVASTGMDSLFVFGSETGSAANAARRGALLHLIALATLTILLIAALTIGYWAITGGLADAGGVATKRLAS